ncbi:hypothetical protein RvY_09129 [Ramazzottius varieornatus]|uniref:CUB domain-containing protein n=1 Tax=Ramazzottius varieornatus TaxID=947166 RepID=A0A1D1V8B1_RAMVA|nr:hypothetical protein RvY_09129 [Ramazzottius varieornatus]
MYGAYYSEILCHDYLTVYGGDPANSTVISKPPRICGGSGLYGASGEVPRPIYAEKRMVVEFHTDFALAGNGFRLVYKTSTNPFPVSTFPTTSSTTRIPWVSRMPAYRLESNKLLI